VTQIQKRKWWGWGLESERYALTDPRSFWSFLEHTIGPLHQTPRIASMSDIPVAPPRLTSADLAMLRELFGHVKFGDAL